MSMLAAREVSSSYDALSDLFEHLGSFLECLDIYTKIQLTPIMTGIIVKIMSELAALGKEGGLQVVNDQGRSFQ
jgi:hypothetical protein